MPQFTCFAQRPALTLSSLITAVVVSAAALGLSACSDSSAPSAVSAPGASTQAMASSGSGAEACLLKAQATPCDLLTASLVHEVMGNDTELSFQTVNLGAASCSVSWSAGRKTTIGKLELETDDNLQLSQIQQLSPNPVFAAERFAANTRQRTEAERQAMGDAVAKKVEESKEIAQESQKLAQEMARGMLDSINYEPVSGVGDAAAWGGLGRFKQLLVLSGTVQFLISANVSNNDDENRQQAAALAQALLAHCQ